MYKHILIPTDGSDLSRAAAVQGVRLAKALGAKVTAFFAAPPATPIAYDGFLPSGYTTTTEHAAMIEKVAAKYLSVIAKAGTQAFRIERTYARRACPISECRAAPRRGTAP